MKIIVLEGADGTGKSTQANLLAERLRSRGYRVRCVRPVFLLFDPWRSGQMPEGLPHLSPRLRRRSGRGQEPAGIRARFRALLLGGVGYGYAWATYLYLRASLRQEQFVVCDRYFYQLFYDLKGPSGVKAALAFPRPHRAFVLEADPEVLRRRKVENLAEDGYLESVLGFYRDLASSLGFVRVDASEDERTVSDTIWRTLWGPGEGVA